MFIMLFIDVEHIFCAPIYENTDCGDSEDSSRSAVTVHLAKVWILRSYLTAIV